MQFFNFDIEQKILHESLSSKKRKILENFAYELFFYQKRNLTKFSASYFKLRIRDFEGRGRGEFFPIFLTNYRLVNTSSSKSVYRPENIFQFFHQLKFPPQNFQTRNQIFFFPFFGSESIVVSPRFYYRFWIMAKKILAVSKASTYACLPIFFAKGKNFEKFRNGGE